MNKPYTGLDTRLLALDDAVFRARSCMKPNHFQPGRANHFIEHVSRPLFATDVQHDQVNRRCLRSWRIGQDLLGDQHPAVFSHGLSGDLEDRHASVVAVVMQYVSKVVNQSS